MSEAWFLVLAGVLMILMCEMQRRTIKRTTAAFWRKVEENYHLRKALDAEDFTSRLFHIRAANLNSPAPTNQVDEK